MSNTRRIFYDVQTGDVIFEIGRGQGMDTPPIEKDIKDYKVLSERNRETFDFLEWEFTRYKEEFDTCISYRVNIELKTVEFQFKEEDEDEEIVFEEPLTEQLNVVKEDVEVVAAMTSLHLEDAEVIISTLSMVLEKIEAIELKLDSLEVK